MLAVAVNVTLTWWNLVKPFLPYVSLCFIFWTGFINWMREQTPKTNIKTRLLLKVWTAVFLFLAYYSFCFFSL